MVFHRLCQIIFFSVALLGAAESSAGGKFVDSYCENSDSLSAKKPFYYCRELGRQTKNFKKNLQETSGAATCESKKKREFILENFRKALNLSKMEIKRDKMHLQSVAEQIVTLATCLEQKNSSNKRKALEKCKSSLRIDSEALDVWMSYFGRKIPAKIKLAKAQRKKMKSAFSEINESLSIAESMLSNFEFKWSNWNESETQNSSQCDSLPATNPNSPTILPTSEVDRKIRNLTTQLVETSRSPRGVPLYRVSSGFVVDCENSKCLVTVEHFLTNAVQGTAEVYYLPEGASMAEAVPLNWKNPIKGPKDDVEILSFSWVGTTLSIADSDHRPIAGQEYIISGFPAANNRGYTNMRCTYLGYSQDNKVFGYALHCPRFGDRHLGGFSGGPMVDPNSGEALGVISTQVGDDQHGYREQIVTPLFRDRGKIQIGLNARPRSCYDLRARKAVNCK